MPAYDFPLLACTALLAALALAPATAAGPLDAHDDVLFSVARDGDGVSVSGDRAPGYAAELEALVEALDSGSADVTGSRVAVRGIARDDGRWQEALEALAARLPASMSLDTDVQVVAAGKPVALLCRELFAASTRQPIRFQLAGATIRSSSHAALDRLVEFDADCPGFAIRITGHSDALGDPAFNLDLSRQRAQSVADYLIARGVAGERLVVEGAGASQPVADNETSYGRRQNRRIEFSLEAAADGD